MFSPEEVDVRVTVDVDQLHCCHLLTTADDLGSKFDHLIARIDTPADGSPSFGEYHHRLRVASRRPGDGGLSLRQTLFIINTEGDHFLVEGVSVECLAGGLCFRRQPLARGEVSGGHLTEIVPIHRSLSLSTLMSLLQAVYDLSDSTGPEVA